MQTAVLMDRILDDHAKMYAQLEEWEKAAALLDAGTFVETQRGLERVWKLVPFFEKQVVPHFHQEETELYPQVEATEPRIAPSLARFSGEHAEFGRQWQAYKRELLYADAVGETTRLREMSLWLIRMLRQHMQDEEREVLRLLEKR